MDSYLITKKVVTELLGLSNKHSDLRKLKSAITKNEQNIIQKLIINKGRSWIESEHVETAIELLEEVSKKYPSDSPEEK